MTVLLAQFHDLPTVSLAAFGLLAAAGLLMGVAPSSLPLVSVVVGSAEVRNNPHGIGEDGLRTIIEAGGFHVIEQTA